MARLPKRYVKFFEDYPDVGSAYEAYGEAVAQAGPLDERTRNLVKLAVSCGARMEGSAKSHAHKAVQAGATADEVRHVALLAAPTVGFPNMMACLGWVNSVLEEEQ
ncbi:MAG: carboxymuconolactone decarboxylase family protein [Fimbriimonadaceae bacterium]|nr:carboxymuconolactone decarboxylase family protein [Fimbriimonadaceae bacterium]